MKISYLGALIRVRDKLINETRYWAHLATQDNSFIFYANKILIPLGFPERDTHTEPDNYNEKEQWKKADKLKILESE